MDWKQIFQGNPLGDEEEAKRAKGEEDTSTDEDWNINEGSDVDPDLPMKFEDIPSVMLEEGDSKYIVVNVEIHKDKEGFTLDKIKKKQFIRGYIDAKWYGFTLQKFVGEECKNIKFTTAYIVVGGIYSLSKEKKLVEIWEDTSIFK